MYRAAHDVGHFRFVECSELDSAAGPSGDITPYAEVFFPYSPDARHAPLDRAAPVRRLAAPGPPIEERYEVDGSGVLTVTITDLASGYARRAVLCR